MSKLGQDFTPAGAWQFTSTHWSVVLAAGEGPSPKADVALEQLCRTYWYPLYAFVRRRGYETHDAQDLTQEFFARLLAKNYLRAIDPKKGKFRSFLLAALEHFLANEWRKARTQKRGGQMAFISINDGSTEKYNLQVIASGLSAEEFYEQQWAITLLEQVIAKLHEEFIATGRQAMFDELKIFLTGAKQSVSYADLAAKLETTEPALKMSVSRMRHRYGELLRAEIAKTVSSPDDVEDELRALFAALSR